MMREKELRAMFIEGMKIVSRERRWRAQVFPEGSSKRKEKLAEMDDLETILTRMKDALKPFVEPDIQQPTLLDIPAAPLPPDYGYSSQPGAKRHE